MSEMIDVILGQFRDIFLSFTQRRNGERNNAESVIEIFSEISFGDFCFEVSVAGCHYSDIDANSPFAAQSLDFVIL